MTAGCLHDCVYCYIRGYKNYPGESRIILYEDTLERLKREVRDSQSKPHAVYFSPSSDLFQPAREVLDLAHVVLEFLFEQGIGVAFLTKGNIPARTLRLLIDNRPLVRAQIGIITLHEHLAHVFEPNAADPQRRLGQLGALIDGGIEAEARIDPVLPTLTDGQEALAQHFAALAQVGVKRAAAGVLFLRSGILYWLKWNVKDKGLLNGLLNAYREATWDAMRGSPWTIQSLPGESRATIFDRMRAVADSFGIELNVCACKNADIVKGTCNIAGRWPSRARAVPQAALPLLRCHSAE